VEVGGGTVTLSAEEARQAGGVAGVSVEADEFAAAVLPHVSVLVDLVARLVPQVDADDATQEALVRAWKRWETFDPSKGSLRGWLCAIALDRARRAHRRSRVVAQLHGHEVAAADEIGRGTDRADLQRAVATLSRRQREAVDLVYFVGLTVADAAVVMGCAEGTVKSTLSDARRRLRPMLEVAP
jgi:RNA polymerase sigma factor (sigma-70 family)